MNKILRSALSICVILQIVLASACGRDTIYAATYNNGQVNAGRYIYALMNAEYIFGTKFKEENEAKPEAERVDTSAEDFEVKNQTLDGKSFQQWVEDEAATQLISQYAIDELFNENKLEFTKEENEKIKTSTDSLWNDETYNMSKFYTQSGISKQSYEEVSRIGTFSATDTPPTSVVSTAAQQTDEKTKLFNALYRGKDIAAKVDGKYISNDELDKEIDRQFAPYYSISFDNYKKDGDAKDLNEEQIALRKAIAEELAARLKAGDDYRHVLAYYDYLVSIANIKAGEEAGISAEDIPSLIDKFKAADDTAAADGTTAEGDTTAGDGADEPADSEATADGTTAEGDTTVGDGADEPADGETTAADETDTTTAIADITTADGTTAPDETTAPSDKIADYIKEENSAETEPIIAKKDDTTPSENFIKHIFAMEKDVPEVYEDGDTLYVLVRTGINSDKIEDYRNHVAHLLKDEDFSKLIQERIEKIRPNFIFNQKAVERYRL